MKARQASHTTVTSAFNQEGTLRLLPPACVVFIRLPMEPPARVIVTMLDDSGISRFPKVPVGVAALNLGSEEARHAGSKSAVLKTIAKLRRAQIAAADAVAADVTGST